MPFNHCPDRLSNRSEEVNRELSPLKLNNKGILMTLQSSQKYVHSVVSDSRAEETPAEEAQRAELLAAAPILLLLPHGRKTNVLCAAKTELLVVVLLLACSSSLSTAQRHCRSCSAQHPCHPFHLLTQRRP